MGATSARCDPRGSCQPRQGARSSSGRQAKAGSMPTHRASSQCPHGRPPHADRGGRCHVGAFSPAWLITATDGATARPSGGCWKQAHTPCLQPVPSQLTSTRRPRRPLPRRHISTRVAPVSPPLADASDPLPCHALPAKPARTLPRHLQSVAGLMPLAQGLFFLCGAALSLPVPCLVVPAHLAMQLRSRSDTREQELPWSSGHADLPLLHSPPPTPGTGRHRVCVSAAGHTKLQMATLGLCGRCHSAGRLDLLSALWALGDEVSVSTTCPASCADGVSQPNR